MREDKCSAARKLLKPEKMKEFGEKNIFIDITLSFNIDTKA